MTPEQAAAFVVAQAAILNARIAGMVAKNMQRAVNRALNNNQPLRASR